MLRTLVQTAIFIAAAIAVVLGLLVAWWIAVAAALCFAIYVAVMRFLGARGIVGTRHPAGHDPVVIEGQYQVEPEDGEPRRGRVIEAAGDKSTP